LKKRKKKRKKEEGVAWPSMEWFGHPIQENDNLRWVLPLQDDSRLLGGGSGTPRAKTHIKLLLFFCEPPQIGQPPLFFYQFIFKNF
jgi:hypothetical protein